jgi:hypothetical protein
MDRRTRALPSARAHDSLEVALREIHVAIALVVAGEAVTVRLVCLDGAERVPFTGAAWAQVAGVAFRLQRDAPDSLALVIGPRAFGPRFETAPTAIATEVRS